MSIRLSPGEKKGPIYGCLVLFSIANNRVIKKTSSWLKVLEVKGPWLLAEDSQGSLGYEPEHCIMRYPKRGVRREGRNEWDFWSFLMSLGSNQDSVIETAG